MHFGKYVKTFLKSFSYSVSSLYYGTVSRLKTVAILDSVVTSFHLHVYFVSSFYVCLLALTRYFMIKKILNIVDLINALSVFLLELL